MWPAIVFVFCYVHENSRNEIRFKRNCHNPFWGNAGISIFANAGTVLPDSVATLHQLHEPSVRTLRPSRLRHTEQPIADCTHLGHPNFPCASTGTLPKRLLRVFTICWAAFTSSGKLSLTPSAATGCMFSLHEMEMNRNENVVVVSVVVVVVSIVVVWATGPQKHRIVLVVVVVVVSIVVVVVLGGSQ